MSNIFKRNTGAKKIGFTFIEVMITFTLFMILASAGVGSYFRYYSFSLINNDVSKVTKVLHEARFKAMKNPYNSDYGVHIGTGTKELTLYRDAYTPGNSENIRTPLEQLDITELDLMPTPGTTNTILFENMTGKTQNTGSFTVSKDDFSYSFNVNQQGAFE